MNCPRCGQKLASNIFGEPECIQCGYTDYSPQPKPAFKTRTLFNSTQISARYCGEYEQSSSTTVTLDIERKTHFTNPRYQPAICPWCGKAMAKTSLDKRWSFYRCEYGHLISLVQDRDNVAWR